MIKLLWLLACAIGLFGAAAAPRHNDVHTGTDAGAGAGAGAEPAFAPCVRNRCQHQSYCCEQRSTGKYECICPVGWTGHLCDIEDRSIGPLRPNVTSVSTGAHTSGGKGFRPRPSSFAYTGCGDVRFHYSITAPEMRVCALGSGATHLRPALFGARLQVTVLNITGAPCLRAVEGEPSEQEPDQLLPLPPRHKDNKGTNPGAHVDVDVNSSSNNGSVLLMHLPETKITTLMSVLAAASTPMCAFLPGIEITSEGSTDRFADNGQRDVQAQIREMWRLALLQRRVIVAACDDPTLDSRLRQAYHDLHLATPVPTKSTADAGCRYDARGEEVCAGASSVDGRLRF